jgi:hypothetical protein
MRRACNQLLAVSACLAASGCHERDLEASEVRELLSGATTSERHEVEGYEAERTYSIDGRLMQTRGASKRVARWWLATHELCIQWDDDARHHCRVVKTDDAGNYWKALYLGKGEWKTTVTFHTIVGPDGADRRRTLPAGERFWRYLGTANALWLWALLSVAGIATLVWLARRY